MAAVFTTFPILLLISLVILGLTITTEYIAPGLLEEGFTTLGSTPYWATYVNPRSDLGPDQEDSTVIRDPRYFNDYADVGRLGVNYDFCRMVSDKEDPKGGLYFACGLAGTDTLTSLSFRTAKTSKGFRVSYDDYMRDINGDGRDDYCRILKLKDGSWQAVCQRATDTGFEEKESIDDSPPEDIKTLLSFYENNVLWLRMMNTLNDYVGNTKILINGNLSLDETPRLDQASGLQFNGIDQFLRLTDGSDVSLGNKVPLRSIRAVMMWVRFDAFTQNAKLFDFGNGKGKDNVFLGILGKGDPSASTDTLRPVQLCVAGQMPSDIPRCAGVPVQLCDQASTIPTDPSGSQGAPEMSPQRLMETTAANVNEYDCKGFETYPRKLSPSFPQVPEDSSANATTATLIYEIWEKEQRRMRIKVNGVVPLKEWVHICVATTNTDAFRPNLAIYINGERVVQRESGFLPAASTMSHCYLGKSNWANAVSKYENRDELFQGAMFDFRMYKGMVSERMIQDSYTWGKGKLGIESA